MDKKKSPHPDWVLAHKRPGTEIRHINGNYYLYKVWCEYDSQTKKPKKRTGQLLGKITQTEGFVESEKALLKKQQMKIDKIEVKEYGITSLFEHQFTDIIDNLKTFFPDNWQTIIALTYGRFAFTSPMKNMFSHYSNSYLSTLYKDVNLSKNSITKFLQSLGAQRNNIVNFFKSFAKDNDSIIFDGTDIFSESKKMDFPKFGKSKFGTFGDIINLMCLFSVNNQMPYYYRILPGNIKDVKAFKLCLKDSGVANATIIVDKGFYSKKNIEELRATNLNFIIPLKRDDKRIDYQKVKDGYIQNFDGYFLYNKRYIWYYSGEIDADEELYFFLDGDLRREEEHDYLSRCDKNPKKYNRQKMLDKHVQFGTLAMIAKKGLSPQDVYVDYKTRTNVEIMIDAFKNNFNADCTYMQNEQSLEAWMFINFLALMFYYKILNLLKANNLNEKYSPHDLIMFLQTIKKIKINNNIWVDAEQTNDIDKLLKKLKILPIP